MKKGVSLIELVFAIVVIGIAAMSFPLILTQTSNNIKIALQQEAILNAKAHASIILSHPWDKNTVDPSTGRLMVLDTTGTVANNAFNATASNTRVGHLYGRRVLATQEINTGTVDLNGIPIFNTVLLTPTTETSSVTEWGNTTLRSDVDDFSGYNDNLSAQLSALDFILDFNLASNVTYVTDNATGYGSNNVNFNFTTGSAGGTTNIKMVKVSATNATRDINITLRAYSSNIGDYELLEKEW
ncbi:MAG: prepilin-type N-terminal cleavage/methylation domain-containing protein [Campylobacteraceae bacterium]|nr:prepilin-type N-terminal cleavage/methylation domain-containing protein [Campylobacteraceae bacterium]